MIKGPVLLVLFSMAGQAIGANDSLLKVWNNKNEHDTVRLQALVELGQRLLHEDGEKALEITRLLIEHASKIGSRNGLGHGHHLQGLLALRDHDLETALAHTTEAFEHFSAARDTSRMVDLLDLLSHIHHDLGDFASAVEVNERGLELAEAMGDEALRYRALLSKASIQFHMGRFDEAIGITLKVLDHHLAHQDSQAISSTYGHLAQIYLHQSRLVDARAAYHDALRYLPPGSNGYDLRKARIYGMLGEIHYHQGDLVQALDHYLQEARTVQRHGDPRSIASTYSSIGKIYFELGEYDRALEEHGKARAIHVKNRNKAGEGAVDSNTGDVLLKKGEVEEALTSYQRAIRAFEEGGDLRSLPHPLIKVGEIYTLKGEFGMAELPLRRALDLATELRAGNNIAEALIGLAGIELATGSIERARALGEKAYATAVDAGAVAVIRDASGLLYDVYKRSGRNDKALQMHERFLVMRDSMLSIAARNELARMDMQFALEKKTLADSLEFAAAQERKELEISEHQANLKKQRIALFSSIGGLVLIVLLAVSIHRGKKRSDDLLLNILPFETAQELKRKGHADARLIEPVTVLFTDFKGFTEMAGSLSPQELVAEIDTCFSAFDRIMDRCGVEKIKTIGDAYMAAGGMPSPKPTHAIDTVRAALEIQHYMREQRYLREREGRPFFEVRIGIHTGPVVAGIVGIKKFQYDIWGDTVNVANRMESGSEVGRVNISGSTYELVKDHFECSYRGEIEAKGKGMVKMYFVDGPRVHAPDQEAFVAEA